MYLKRKSIHGTLVGSLSGAMPPVIGYVSVTNSLDTAALVLFVMFSLWQMPHSYAIAIFRFNDYLAASIPVLPVKRGIQVAKKHILIYILAFLVATLMLTFSGYTGVSYLAVSTAMGSYWLYISWTGYKALNDTIWARKLFVFSIFTITALSVMMSLDFRVTKDLLMFCEH